MRRPAVIWTKAAVIAAVALVGGGRMAGACTLEQGETRSVARVIDADTLLLDDGRQVRLIGALGPRHQDADADAVFWQPEVEARAALEQLTTGRSVELGFAGRRVDRHGRLLAHVFIAGDEPRTWVQGEMVRLGHARAYTLPGNSACFTALAAWEAIARGGELGLWRNAAYHLRASDPPWPIMVGRDRFQIVEGVVTNASDVRGQVYLNFGADWRSDFTVQLQPSVRRALAARDIKATELAGARVRVRGWIAWRNGPFIDLADAGELEIVTPAPVSIVASELAAAANPQALPAATTGPRTSRLHRTAVRADAPATTQK